MLTINEIRKLPVLEVLSLAQLKTSFVLVYNIRQQSNGGAYFFDREMNFIKKLWADQDYMKNAEPWSLYAAILNLGYYGLSIESIPKALAYIFPRGGGNKLIYDISPYGELALKMKSGSIHSIGGPYFIFEGDDITIKDGKVHHNSLLKSQVITGAWMRVFRNAENTIYDDKYFSMEQILSYKKQSKTPGSTGWTGGVEGQPTRGMIEGKVIKHGLATYARGVPVKSGVTFGSALDEEQAQSAADDAYAQAIGSLTNGQDEDPETPETTATTATPTNGTEKPTNSTEVVEISTPAPATKVPQWDF